MNTKALRKTICAKRAALTSSQRDTAAGKLFNNIYNLPAFIDAQKIAAYISFRGEICPASLLEHARSLNKKTYLPIVVDQALKFANVTSTTKMLKGKFNIPIPEFKPSELIEPESLDLVLVPLVAFDEKLNRVGMGGGYYDRSFEFRASSKTNPLLIGLAHEFQKTTPIPSQPWDIPMDLLITDEHIYNSDKNA